MVFCEFFAGIGGFGCAAERVGVGVGAAFDVDVDAGAVYRANLGVLPSRRNLADISAAKISRTGCTGWFLSPPCQPFTSRGKQRDDLDPRSGPLLRLIELLPECRPRYLLLENVPPFGDSRTLALLRETLTQAELHATEVTLCPTALGIPNRRLRYYLLASAEPVGPEPARPVCDRPLAAYLDREPDPTLFVTPELLRRVDRNRDIIGPTGIAACFGSSYGRVHYGAGSYLEDPQTGRIRRFSHEEILRLLHFPEDFAFPPGLTLARRYHLAGNSVNVAVVEHLLRWLVG